MIEAGSKSTSSTLLSCLEFMAANPATQDRAHAEISSVVGDTQFPKFGHRASSPYISACVQEALRLRPSTNNGSPHYTSADVVYKDFVVPDGTVVSLYQYTPFSDPSLYADPEQFCPERHVHGDESNEKSGSNHSKAAVGLERYVWGAGRRICPGMHLAENTLFVILPSILWAFYVRPELNSDGTDMEVDVSDDAYEAGR